MRIGIPKEVSPGESRTAGVPETVQRFVAGGLDVINPASRDDKSSPIFGMPILDVDRARTVMVCKRTLNPGFAGIDNELFYQDNTSMLFGDAKSMVTQINAALRASPE